MIQQKIVQESRVDVDTDIVFKNPKKVDDKEIVCLYNPDNSLCDPDPKGKCPSGWATNEDGRCFPMDKPCPKGYWRADDDETGACVPKTKTLTQAEFDKSELPECDGSLQDCVTENGDVCPAGSTDHECELEEVQPADFVKAPKAEEDDFETDDDAGDGDGEGDESGSDGDGEDDSDDDVDAEVIESDGDDSSQD